VENLDEPITICIHLTVRDLVCTVFFYSQCREQVLSNLGKKVVILRIKLMMG